MRLTIPSHRASRLRVWILVPAAGDLIHATFSTNLITLLGLLRTHGIWYSLHYLPGDSLVTRARNNLADIFYTASSDDNDHLALWLDCDILFDPHAVLQMLALDLDFVAAPYSKKGIHVDRLKAAAELGWDNDKIMRVVGTPNVNWLAHPIRCDEPMPVLEAGSGFWLTKRKVYRMMVEALPHIRYKRAAEEIAHYGTDHAHDFFRVGVWPETSEYLSEDWWFCREWRNLGGVVHCCFWIKTYHIGRHMFPMDMPAIANLLTATNGFINGPTKGESNVTSEAPGNGRDHGSDAGLSIVIVPIAPSEATVPRDPGALGG